MRKKRRKNAGFDMPALELWDLNDGKFDGLPKKRLRRPSSDGSRRVPHVTASNTEAYVDHESGIVVRGM